MKQLLLYVLLAGSVALAEDAAPTFPLKTPAILAIADKLPDDAESAMVVEKTALLDVFRALKGLPVPEKYEGVTFANLMRFPEKHRGEIVTVKGVVTAIQEFKVPKNALGLARVWRAIVFNPPDQFYSVLVTHEPSLDTQVETRGCFLKRHTFLNKMAGERLTWTPLVLANSLQASVGNPVAAPDPAQLLKLPRENRTSELIVPTPLYMQLRAIENIWSAELDGAVWSLEKQKLPLLVARLQARVDALVASGDAERGADGTVNTTITLRVPEETPMTMVEAAVLSLARVGLMDVKYVANTPLQIGPASPAPLNNIRIHLSQKDSVVYTLNGKAHTRAECLDALRASVKRAPCQVRVSYDADVPYGTITDSFKLCNEAGIQDCNLFPTK